MSFSNLTEQQLLDYIALGTAPPWAADATWYVAYHTADPGEGGDQTTSEASYTGYARVAVARSAVDFSRSGSVLANVQNLEFPECTDAPGFSQTMTHASIGRAASGAGQIIWKGALGTPGSPATIVVVPNSTPRILAGTATLTLD